MAKLIAQLIFSIVATIAAYVLIDNLHIFAGIMLLLWANNVTRDE